jgi:Holliday junction resolvase-like predicted endonuclease
MTTTETGRRAEAATAAYLASHGFAILARNWRTRWCELDLIVRRDQVVYVVEVKYRATSSRGSGLDWITATKLRQLRLGTSLWCILKHYDGAVGWLAAAVTGPDFKVERIVSIT